MKINYGLLLGFLFFISCEKKEANNPVKGEMTIATDESFKNVAEALTERYVAFYPNTKINLKLENENLALSDLLNDKVRVIIMSRSLTEQEKQLYKEKVGGAFQPARFAADGLVFITSKNASRKSIAPNEIKAELLSGEKKIIFNGLNGSNFNYLAQKFKLSPEQVKCAVLNSDVDIIHQIQNFPNSIGVISYNTISSPFSKEAQALRSKINILPIVVQGKSFVPNIENLKNMSYPFTRVLYFLTNEGYFGLGNGLIRFSCTQKGQIVVGKEGLQPYNIFKREVIMR